MSLFSRSNGIGSSWEGKIA